MIKIIKVRLQNLETNIVNHCPIAIKLINIYLVWYKII